MNELKPNFTQIPNIFLDDLLYQLSPSQTKVALYIMRRTYGFQKQSDRISISQICNGIKDRDGNTLDNGTGLSNRAVIDALNGLEEIGLIILEKSQNKTTKVTMNTSGEKSSLVKKVHSSGEKSSQDVVKKVHTQKKGKKVLERKITEQSSDEGNFYLEEELKKMFGVKDRRMGIIADFLWRKKPDLKSKDQLNITIRRHLRSATDLNKFDDDQIVTTMERLDKEFPKYTLETVLKELTK